ncbi:YcxB family protein [Actinoplanes derwentensis]|uniref:YcxB family protein n=1 Tax=Actinoplanes derwentensis TaxID=113562 RepID=UPI0012FD8809|nr:YcxB family protein [Actinoplanes derwentensis]
MNITGTFQHSYSSFRRLSMAALGKARFGMWISGGLILLLAVTTDAFQDSPVLYAAPLVIVFPELIAYLSWRQQRKILTEPVHYEINETELYTRAAHSESRLAWSGLTWVKSTKHGWLLKTGVMQVVLPRPAFSPEEQATIEAFLKTAPVKVKS